MSEAIHIDSIPQARRINWLENTSKSLEALFPEKNVHSEYIAQQLAALLLQRLPRETAESILVLLPVSDEYLSLLPSAASESDTSIGYATFVRSALHALGCSSPGAKWICESCTEEELDRLCRQIVDTFLAALARTIPHELTTTMAEALPSEIRSRMHLEYRPAGDSKAA